MDRRESHLLRTAGVVFSGREDRRGLHAEGARLCLGGLGFETQRGSTKYHRLSCCASPRTDVSWIFFLFQGMFLPWLLVLRIISRGSNWLIFIHSPVWRGAGPQGATSCPDSCRSPYAAAVWAFPECHENVITQYAIFSGRPFIEQHTFKIH